MTMTFNDGQNSVSSLLALLKQTQDSTPQPSTSQPTQAGQPHATQGYNPYTPSYPTSTSSVNPTQRQLDELLASLNNPSSSSSSSSSSLSSTSAFAGPKRDLIQPFGPIGSAKKGSFDHTSLPPVQDPHAGTQRTTSDVEGGDGRGSEQPGFEVMPFTKALSIISDLLSKEEFKKELKKMKAEQDSLERRLWAKQEKLKSDHDRSHQAERDIARIRRQPVPKEKEQEWNAELQSALRDFYLSTALPSLDGIALRHRDRLLDLGVPGLGGEEGDERKKRVKRIMDVLQAAMDE